MSQPSPFPRSSGPDSDLSSDMMRPRTPRLIALSRPEPLNLPNSRADAQLVAKVGRPEGVHLMDLLSVVSGIDWRDLAAGRNGEASNGGGVKGPAPFTEVDQMFGTSPASKALGVGRGWKVVSPRERRRVLLLILLWTGITKGRPIHTTLGTKLVLIASWTPSNSLLTLSLDPHLIGL